MTPFNCPVDLEAALAARGYQSFDETLVQAARLGQAPAVPEAPGDVEIMTLDADAFVDAAGELRGSPTAQRDAHRERLANSPLDKRCVAIRAAGRVVCTAQVAIEGGLVGVYDVVTAEDAARERLRDARLRVAAVVGVAARRECRLSAGQRRQRAGARDLSQVRVRDRVYVSLSRPAGAMRVRVSERSELARRARAKERPAPDNLRDRVS